MQYAYESCSDGSQQKNMPRSNLFLFLSVLVLVLISTHIERVSVSPVRDPQIIKGSAVREVCAGISLTSGVQLACQSIWIGNQLGRAKEEGKIEDHANMKEILVTLKIQKYVQYWSCNNKSKGLVSKGIFET